MKKHELGFGEGDTIDPKEHGHLTLVGLMEEIQRDTAARQRLEEYGKLLNEASEAPVRDDSGIER